MPSSAAVTPASTPSEDRLSVKRLMADLLQSAASGHAHGDDGKEMLRMQNMLEETLTKNMHLQRDLENMATEIVRLSKINNGAPPQ